MATPQRQPSDEPKRGPQPDLGNLQKGGVERQVSSGWRFGFWWLWILVIVGIWYVGFGWGNSGGWIWGHRTPTPQATNDAAMTGDGVPILNSTNKLQYVGQAFVIRNAPVESVASQKAMWIGSRFNSVPMLVVFPAGANVTAPPEGANGPTQLPPNTPGVVKVTPKNSHVVGAAGGQKPGTANTGNTSGHAAGNAGAAPPMPTHLWLDVTGKVEKAPPAAQARQQWDLSNREADQLEQEGVYIQATQAQTTRP